MWPSRMPRTASATSSLWSSPSTSTLKMPVMVPCPWTGALEQARQLDEHGGSISLGGRRLARRLDLALSHGKACHRVHQHQHVLAEIAKILSDGERQISAYRRISAGSSEVETASTERARPAAPSVLQEFLHFTAAFSDEADDGNVRRNITGKHRQEDRLADAGARENTHALAAADRDERVERAHAKIERLTNAARGMRRWRQRAVATARPATALTRRSYRVGRKLIVGQADHAAERASYEVVALRLSSPP